MDLALLRRLLREGSQVVLLEEGHPPLVVRQLRTEEPPEEVPIASRWPKGFPYRPAGTGRSVLDGRRAGDRAEAEPGEPASGRQEQILERLNKEILALKDQIAQEGDGGTEPLT
jgi:hypothetical protein